MQNDIHYYLYIICDISHRKEFECFYNCIEHNYIKYSIDPGKQPIEFHKRVSWISTFRSELGKVHTELRVSFCPEPGTRGREGLLVCLCCAQSWEQERQKEMEQVGS